ncbi:MAG: hypothetical protein IPL33_04855 [Sphingobacteriales bacterium]|nr:hypothetical protein [Sphingobacteriales bacterium]
MFRFEQPAYIYIVLLWIAIAVAGYYLLHRRRQEIWASVGQLAIDSTPIARFF